MASRQTRKSTSRTAETRVDRLPGAVFFGSVYRSERWQLTVTRQHSENIEYAERLQQIRKDYENDDCQEMLWHDLSQMGFESSDICRFVAHPALITNCGYRPAPELR